MIRYYLKIIILTLTTVSLIRCSSENPQGKDEHKKLTGFDMREGLIPHRLTIAMWDFSWLYMHYKGGTFEVFENSIDELKERGFNTVRIDAFPLVIGKLESPDQELTVKGDPLRNWGQTDIDRKHRVISELLDFMKIAKEKGINVILSTWATEEFIELGNYKEDYASREEFWRAWEKTLNILKENDLLSNVLYVDFDQEFPYFSPFAPEIERLGSVNDNAFLSPVDAMNAAGRPEYNSGDLEWNSHQMLFVRRHMESTLTHFQKLYPELRFTFSLTSFWNEVRAMKLNNFDVLELHFWMTQSNRFESRTGFENLNKDRGEHDYSDYMDRIEKTMKSMRPMLLKDMHNRLSFARSWSEEVAAPLVTTEAWGPWWHMDHKDLNWEWLYDWCEECMSISNEYGLWGVTPWNYSHPYSKNWEDVKWYQRINSTFIEN